MLTIEAPAKINLTLEVLGKRPDGYHEIRSVIQTINFCDSLQIAPGNDIQFKSNMPDWSPEQSLVAKAVKLLARNNRLYQRRNNRNQETHPSDVGIRRR